VASHLPVTGLFLLALALGAVSLPLAATNGPLSATDVLNNVVLALLIVTEAAVGLVVAWYQPGNPMGWLLLGSGAFFALNGDASSLELLDSRIHHGHLPFGPLAVVLQPSWAPAIALLGLAFLLYPDGRPLSPAWRWVVRLYLAVAALWVGGAFAITITAVIGHYIRVNPGGDLALIDHPTGTAALWGLSQDVFFTVLSVSWLASVIRQVASYRRSSGERRQQLKWLASGAAICLAGGVLTLSTSGRTGVVGIVGEAGVLGLAALPAAMGVGVLKFRLYEIDRIVSRALAYAVLTGLLVGVYAGLVLLATRVLPFSGSVAVAGATLAAAALFNPLRLRVQRVVDRRFNRARYNADQMTAAFAARLQDATDLDGVRADLLGTVRRALEPAHASVWLSRGGPR
jgi:hypothetical protein